MTAATPSPDPGLRTRSHAAPHAAPGPWRAGAGGGWCARALLLGICGLLGCAGLPDNSGRSFSFALPDTDDTALGRRWDEDRQAHPLESGFHLLADGREAFQARVLLAEAAERSIDAQYYLLHADLTGHLFIAALVAAAERGVRVRLLLDDLDLGGKDLPLAALDSVPGLEVRVFNPFQRGRSRMRQLITGLGTLTRRMHNKSFTVDNQATIVGGRNIGDEYFRADPDMAFGDLDVLAVGPVVGAVSASFDLYWNSELAYPIALLVSRPPTTKELREARRRLATTLASPESSAYQQALAETGLGERLRDTDLPLRWGRAQVVHDRPEKILHGGERKDLHLASQLGPHLRGVQEELLIFSPYFVPGDEGVDALAALTGRGVRVRVLTNSLASNDVGIVHAGYARYRRDLLRAGVELHEVDRTLSRDDRKARRGPTGSSKASLHAKSFVMDRQRVFIGSLNLDPRSIHENTEVGIVLESAEIAREMADWFDANIDRVAFRLELDPGWLCDGILWYDLEDGQEQVFDVDPHTGFFRRLGLWFAGLLPIESQL